MNLTPMDHVRAALADAMAEGLDVSEIWEAANGCETVEAFIGAIGAVADAKRAMGIAGPAHTYNEVTGGLGVSAQDTETALRRALAPLMGIALRKPVAPCRKRPQVQTVTVDMQAGASISDMLTEACKGTQFQVVKV